MLFTQLRVHLLDKGLRVTDTAVYGLNNAIPMHWKELPRLWITNLGSTDFSHFVNACFLWIFTMKWFLCFCRNQTMGLINYWSEVVHGQILLHHTMFLKGSKGKLQDFEASTLRRTIRLVHGQSVSWNNETNLLGKGEFICDYIHGSLLIHSLSW